MATVENTRSAGRPAAVQVGGDGARVVYLRGGQLWVHDVSTARARQLTESGVTGYATDAAAQQAVFVRQQRLWRADLLTGEQAMITTAGRVCDPRLDPTGARIGYLTGNGLHVIDESGRDTRLAGEPPAGGLPYLSWGQPEPAVARQFGRRRGWWWSPDGQQLLAARVSQARAQPEVSLHLLDLDGGWVDVHWDRETYPYLVSVCWADHRDPLIAVLRRPQQHGLVLAVDARTGETQVHAELADPRWVEPVPGTPCHLSDGRVLVGGELAHDGYDARCLFADGTLLTPPSLYVRRVVGRLADGAELLVEGSAGEPSEQHLFRVSTAVSIGGIDAHRLTTVPGWHRGVVGGGTVVIGSESLEHTGRRWTLWRQGALVGELDRPAASTSVDTPQPQFARATDRRLPTGVVYPRWQVAGRRLPVLLETAGGHQGVRAVRADWQHRQEWADAGFAVLVVDPRGTPGVAPSFEKVVHRRLADLALADLADALAALAGKHPDLDLDRVGVCGTGVGGWLAALAALRRPEQFRAAVARAPLVDWAEADPPLTERYLGPREESYEVYPHHSLLVAAEQAGPGQGRPILVVAEPAEPAPAHRLAAGLAANQQPHTLLPAPDRAAELAFLRHALASQDRSAQ